MELVYDKAIDEETKNLLIALKAISGCRKPIVVFVTTGKRSSVVRYPGGYKLTLESSYQEDVVKAFTSLHRKIYGSCKFFNLRVREFLETTKISVSSMREFPF